MSPSFSHLQVLSLPNSLVSTPRSFPSRSNPSVVAVFVAHLCLHRRAFSLLCCHLLVSSAYPCPTYWRPHRGVSTGPRCCSSAAPSPSSHQSLVDLFVISFSVTLPTRLSPGCLLRAACLRLSIIASTAHASPYQANQSLCASDRRQGFRILRSQPSTFSF